MDTTRTRSVQMRRAAAAVAAFAALTLAACSSPSPEQQRLIDYWDNLGPGGRQTVCLALAVYPDAREAVEEVGPEALPFLDAQCEDVELPPNPSALGLDEIPA